LRLLFASVSESLRLLFASVSESLPT
jgi:hypothetical protein